MREKQILSRKTIGLLGAPILSFALIGLIPSAFGNEDAKKPKQQKEIQQSAQQTEQQQAPQQSQEQQRQQQLQQQQSQAQQPRVQSSQVQGQAYMENHFLSSETLIGHPVRNQQGEEVGDIHDLLIDPQKKTAPFAVVSFGGLLGIGDDLYAIPWEQIKHDHERGDCVLNVPGAPENVATARPDWIALEEDFSEEEPKFGQGPYGLKKAEEGEIEGQVQTAPSGTSHLVSADEVLENDLQGRGANQEIGEIEGLIIGSGQGHLVCAIVEVDLEGDRPVRPQGEGAVGDADPGLQANPADDLDDVAIPITLVEFDDANLAFTTTVTPEELKGAPEIDDDLVEERKSFDRQWVENVFQHFNEDLSRIGRDLPTKTKAIALEK